MELMGQARSADDSGLLFSPLPPPESETDGMADERGADSVLFSLDKITSDARVVETPAVQDEGSGLVDIRGMVAAAQPEAAAPAGDRDSSGLVDMKALMAEAEAQPSDSSSLISAPLTATPLPTTTPTPVPEAKPPAIPTTLLVVVIAALLATIGVLAWKATGG